MEVLIRKPRNQEEYEEKINFCITEVDRLNHLVDQLLLLARFENQKQNIKSESVYLNALVLDNLARYSDKIKSKQITIETNFKDDFYVNSDNYLLSIVIGNLISNAVKFTPPGGKITVLASYTQEQSDKIFLRLTVQDTGCGISEEMQNRLFLPFEQESPETALSRIPRRSTRWA